MSQNPTIKRPDEEALAVLIMLAAIGLGSSFALAKAIKNRFLGPLPKKAEYGNNVGKVKLKAEEMKEQVSSELDATRLIENTRSRTDTSSNTTIGIPAVLESLRDEESIGRFLRDLDTIGKFSFASNSESIKEVFQRIQAEVQRLQLLSTQRKHDRKQAIEAIRAWEQATISRIQREKARRLGRATSLGQHEMSRKYDQEAVEAWEQSTVGKFRKERVRRLERLPSLDDFRFLRDKIIEALRVWEESKIRGECIEASQKAALDAVRAWEKRQDETHKTGR